ncbi:MAG: hypothetical protein ABW185_07330 [Sedimenticola sp.]
MAQAALDQEEVFSAIVFPEEKQISASFTGISRVTVKKIRADVFIIIQDDEGMHHIINANLLKSLHGFYESILLLIAVAEGL